MSRKNIFLIAFFTVLVFAFFFIMSYVIPEFRNPKFPPIGEVQSFSFVNQDGERVTREVLKDKVTAVEFFFTTCKGICPKMNNNMKKVYEAYRNEPGFLILSHTSDPGTDSAARLKRYADSLGVDTDRWMFLTGAKDSLYYMARHSYKIDDPKNNLASIEDDFLHTQFVALVNKEGKVVKIFDALKGSEMSSMIGEIGKLLKN